MTHPPNESIRPNRHDDSPKLNLNNMESNKTTSSTTRPPSPLLAFPASSSSSQMSHENSNRLNSTNNTKLLDINLPNLVSRLRDAKHGIPVTHVRSGVLGIMRPNLTYCFSGRSLISWVQECFLSLKEGEDTFNILNQERKLDKNQQKENQEQDHYHHNYHHNHHHHHHNICKDRSIAHQICNHLLKRQIFCQINQWNQMIPCNSIPKVASERDSNQQKNIQTSPNTNNVISTNTIDDNTAYVAKGKGGGNDGGNDGDNGGGGGNGGGNDGSGIGSGIGSGSGGGNVITNDGDVNQSDKMVGDNYSGSVKEMSEFQVIDSPNVFYRFTKAYQRRICIIGGGFAGAKLSKNLERENYFNITLIDRKSYFEYTLSLPFLFERGGESYVKQSLRIEYSKILKNSNVITTSVTNVTNDYIHCGNGTKIPTSDFDIIVICTGSQYDLSRIPVKITKNSLNKDDSANSYFQDLISDFNPRKKELPNIGVYEIQDSNSILMNHHTNPYDNNQTAVIVSGAKFEDMLQNYSRILNSKRITVIGTGLNGVEISSSLALGFPTKKITIVSSATRIMERACPNAHEKVIEFFKSMKNVELFTGEKVLRIEDNLVITSRMRKIESDVIIVCTGFQPNTKFLQRDGEKKMLEESKNDTKCPNVRDSLGEYHSNLVTNLLSSLSLQKNLSVSTSGSISDMSQVIDLAESNSISQKDGENVNKIMQDEKFVSMDFKSKMHHCCRHGYLQTLKKLIKQFISEDSKSTKKQKKRGVHDESDVTDEMVCDYDIGLCKRLLNSSQNKCTLLHTAAKYSQIEVMEYLIEIEPNLISSMDSLRATPLFYAISSGSLSTVTYLLGKGCNANCKDFYEFSPLGLAIHKNYFHIVKVLILFGADVNYKGKNGNSILHTVCKKGNISAARYLLEQENAQLVCLNRNHETPLMLALPHPELVNYLMSYILEFHPSKVTKWIQILDSNENSIFHLAVMHNHIPSLLNILCKLPDSSLIRLLNEKHSSTGLTPFETAVEKKNTIATLIFCMTECIDVDKRLMQIETDPMILNFLSLIPQRKWIQYQEQLNQSPNPQSQLSPIIQEMEVLQSPSALNTLEPSQPSISDLRSRSTSVMEKSLPLGRSTVVKQRPRSMALKKSEIVPVDIEGYSEEDKKKIVMKEGEEMVSPWGETPAYISVSRRRRNKQKNLDSIDHQKELQQNVNNDIIISNTGEETAGNYFTSVKIELNSNRSRSYTLCFHAEDSNSFGEDDKKLEAIELMKNSFGNDSEKKRYMEMISAAYGSATILDRNGFIKVDQHFRVKGFGKFFALGDVTDINEEKLAQTAQIHASMMFQNIKKMELRQELASYYPSSRKCVVSLGSKRALLTYNGRIILDSMISSKIKDFVEMRVMNELKK